MAITINRDQRDAMYQEVVLDLNGQRFVFDMRLLDDLGWEPEPEADEFTLTMDGVDLAWVVSHMIEQTGAIIHTHVVEPIERTPHAERSVKAQSAFGSILGQLAQGRAADEEPRDLHEPRDR
jgi:hypothetical protein